VLATFDGGVYPGDPAVTRRRFGQTSGREGSAWYFATELAPALLEQLLLRAAAAAGVLPVLDLNPWPAELDAVVRRSANAQYLFLFNHGAVEISVPAAGLDLLTGERSSRSTTVPGGGVAVLATPTA
jgi:beta-galactosidase